MFGANDDSWWQGVGQVSNSIWSLGAGIGTIDVESKRVFFIITDNINVLSYRIEFVTSHDVWVARYMRNLDRYFQLIRLARNVLF